MLEKLLTEQTNPASEGFDAKPTEEILRIMNAEDQKVAVAVAAAVPSIARAVDGITERLRAGGRLMYIGAGTSGRLGVLDAAECRPTFRKERFQANICRCFVCSNRSKIVPGRNIAAFRSNCRC